MTHHRGTIALLDLSTISSFSGENCVESSFRRFARHSLLEWSVRRLRESTLIDAIVVTGPASLSNAIAQSHLGDAIWAPSDSPSPVERAWKVAEENDVQWMVFTSPRCPFVDAILLDRLIRAGWSNPDTDYVGFFSPTRPTFSIGALGLVGEMCHRRALEKLAKGIGKNSEMASPDLRSVPAQVKFNEQLFLSRMIPLPTTLDDEELRFSLETPDDWEKADALLEASGEEADYQRLASFSQGQRSAPRPHLLSARSKRTPR